MISALAHVIVTEGLVANDYVAQRCDDTSFQQWCEFVARPENSPEALSLVMGVDAEDIRAAARLQSGAFHELAR